MAIRRDTLAERAMGSRAADRVRAVLIQRWLHLGFLHFAYEPEDLAPLVPRGLQIDTFPDAGGVQKAWVGLVGFRIEGARPTFAPPFPGLSSFDELNVRTYVRHPEYGPGVLFLSLDAHSRIVGAIAWPWFKVRYRRAEPVCVRDGGRVLYKSVRRDWRPASTRIEAEVLEAPREAEPGTLEHFLVERYRFYSESRGRLWSGCVRHEPYRLCPLRVERFESTHLAALGLRNVPLAHACYANGVRSEFFPVRRV